MPGFGQSSEALHGVIKSLAVTYVPLGFTIRSCELDYGIYRKWRIDKPHY